MAKKPRPTVAREKKMLWVINELLWMAARYAHGRHTYAPHSVRTAINCVSQLFPDWAPRSDLTILPPKPSEYKGGIQFRDDWLDDIFLPPPIDGKPNE